MNEWIVLAFLVFFVSCSQRKSVSEEKGLILRADRETTLGWVFLKVYNDYTFEFHSRGPWRRAFVYPGTVEVKNDTLIFNYTDSIPGAGSKAVIQKDRVNYFNGEYNESLEVKLNELKNE